MQISLKVIPRLYSTNRVVRPVEDMILSRSMATNLIVPSPVRQDRLTLVLLHFEVVCIFVVLTAAPDQLAVLIEDHRVSWCDAAMWRNEDEARVVATTICAAGGILLEEIEARADDLRRGDDLMQWI